MQDLASQPPHWLTALNPPVYLVSILPGLGVLPLAGGAPLQAGPLAAATLAVVLLQHAINLFNDAADWRLGADTEKLDSWVRVHGERSSLAVWHGLLSFLAGGLLGLFVLWHQQQLWLLWIALPMVLLGYLYNAGSRPLSYTHFGEWVTGLCYGPGVFGCLWLVAGLAPGLAMAFGMVAFAALAVALLLSHQPPQIETDRIAGKRSFAVRFGTARTLRVVRVLFLVFLAALLAGAGSGLDAWRGGVLVLSAVAAMVWLARATPNPRLVLSAASLFIVVALVLAT